MSKQGKRDHDDEPKQPPDLFDELRKLSLRASADLLSFKSRLNEIGDQFDGTPLAGGEGSGISNRPRPEPGELVYQVARMQLDLANHLLSLGNQHAELWVDRARRFATVVSKPERRAPVRLTAQPNPEESGVTWSPLHVYNARRETVTLRVRALGWLGPSGPIMMEPPTLHVEPATMPPRSNIKAAIVLDEIPPHLDGGDHLIEAEVELDNTPIGRLALTLRLSTDT